MSKNNSYNKNKTNDFSVDNFVNVINKNIKKTNKFYNSTDPTIIKKNNEYLFNFARTGLKCMKHPK